MRRTTEQFIERSDTRDQAAEVLQHTYGKDELHCLGTLCGRDQYSKTVSKPLTGQFLALIMAENGHDTRQMTFSRAIAAYTLDVSST